MSREANLARLRDEHFDVLIMGGGINGAGIARDLVLRDAGLRVALVEKNHFASGTSSRNSQLIHGLRYLKYFDFHLVREALRERATLLAMSGGLVEPLKFFIPCEGLIDRWYYGAGLRLYDLLAGKYGIGRHRSVDAGLLSYDRKVNSPRLMLEIVIDAESHGAAAANYVEAKVGGKQIEASDSLAGERFPVRADKVVDATGAWSNGAHYDWSAGRTSFSPAFNKGMRRARSSTRKAAPFF